MSVRKITLYDYLQRSLEKFPDNKSYSFINGEGLTYRQFGEKVKSLQQILGNNGIGQGDRVAILGSSMPSWPVAYMAVTTSARIAVPILPDFTAFEISNVITHSESKAIFVSKKLLYKLSESIKSRLNLIVLLDTFEIIKGEAAATADAPCEPLPESESVASIIYTSGTSGTSKGVMLTHGNITSNLQMMYELYPVMENDVFLSLLPLSHAYECTIGMLYPLTEGASVYYLDGAPTPSALIPALKKVRPTCILSVPLIVEKIYKNKIRPIFTRNWIMQTLYSIMPVRRILHKFAGKKLLEMSPATADRLLRPEREKMQLRGKSGTRSPGASLNSLIPVRAYYSYAERNEAGCFEIDTVVHCGYGPQNDSLWTLSLTDVANGFIYIRPLRAKTQRYVLEALDDIAENTS